jgi:hypothetical protein
MKTPIQQALHRLNEQIDTLNAVKDHTQHAYAVLRFLKQERDFLTALLPTEREVIETAFKEGFGNWIEPSDYFTTKFNDNEPKN